MKYTILGLSLISFVFLKMRIILIIKKINI